MFGYLLLLAELAMLIFLYWLFCVRKAPEYKIQGDPWGMYPQAKRGMTKLFQTGKNRALARKSNQVAEQRQAIKVHQTRKNGWVFSDKEKLALQEITGVHLEVTASHLIKEEETEEDVSA